MTGYASAQHSSATATPDSDAKTDSKSTSTRRLGIEIRSVNSRFLDLSFRLPDELRSHEPALRERVMAQLKRGKVEVRAAIESSASGSLAAPSPHLLQRVNSLQDSVKAWLPQAAPLSVADILRMASNEQAPANDWADDVLPLDDTLARHLPPAAPRLPTPAHPAATQPPVPERQPPLDATVLQSLVAARQREGERLTTMLIGHLKQLRALAEKALPLVPHLVEQQRQRFIERWKEAMALAEGATLPEAAQDRALTEATAFAIRIDVAEELTRLHSHLDEMERILKKGGEVGKRLDFLIQELHRAGADPHFGGYEGVDRANAGAGAERGVIAWIYKKSASCAYSISASSYKR